MNTAYINYIEDNQEPRQIFSVFQIKLTKIHNLDKYPLFHCIYKNCPHMYVYIVHMEINCLNSETLAKMFRKTIYIHQLNHPKIVIIEVI